MGGNSGRKRSETSFARIGTLHFDAVTLIMGGLPASSPPAMHQMNPLRLNPLVLLIAIGLSGSCFAEGKTPTPQDLVFFENKIRPVLIKHCYECHSADAKEVGGKLLLDVFEGLQKGGESGAAINSKLPDSSLVIQALKYDGIEMPPNERLSETIVNDFRTWIQRGAPMPQRQSPKGSSKSVPDATTLWSLQPKVNPSVPSVGNKAWPRDPVDHFILAKIEAGKLQPTHDAGPRVLARRMSFDLTGLPLSMKRTQAFVQEHNANPIAAIERLADELLASPQFGERWGRHWLDVARYAEANGNDGLGRNPTFPHAWRYRDYVIAAFNADTPYNRFLTEQIAGDLLPTDTPEERDRNLVATGFLAMAAKPAKAMNNNFNMDVVADQIDVVGSGIMGLSVACARCHDHKFDPVPMKDYYAVAGFFTSSETMWGVAANEGLTAPKTDLHVLTAAPRVLPPAGFVETVLVPESNTGKPKPIPKPPWPAGTPLAMGVRDHKKPADCKLNIKGDAKKLGDAVPRGFLTAIRLDQTQQVKLSGKQSGRLELAQWLTSPGHPLTARVIVNRVWQHLLGTGIVKTPNDFGVYGERPTHPELLDHLAVRFTEDGWSIKKLIRAIVLTRTYQLSSQADPELLAKDDGNQLLARHTRRRLDAESLRDSMLFASGELDLTPGDGSIVRHRDILVNLAGNLHEPTNKRSIYLCYLRSSPPPELAAFDLPDFITVTGRRNVSTVPNQALHLFNNPFVIEQATMFASHVMSQSADQRSRIQFAWNKAFSRDPNVDEVKKAVSFLREAEYELKDASKAWASLCQALLATNEFRYVD